MDTSKRRLKRRSLNKMGNKSVKDLGYKFILNPDGLFVRELRKRIKDNNGYCPYKIEKIHANKCPCEVYKKEGYCECGLYIRIPNYEEE